MILSEETSDYDLSIALGKFFKDYSDINSLKHLGSWDEARTLLKQYGFRTNGYKAKRNVDRFLCFKEHYFDRWNANLPPNAIATLANAGKGYGPKFARALYAYWKGEQNVLPLDGQALKALHALDLYKYDKTGGRAREDIESKLKVEIPLIDFHELLRFMGQTGGRDPEHFNSGIKVIIGWNAWRLLCSSKRAEITEDWISKHLVTDASIAQQLWDFFREISDQ
jgi:endonuclease III